MCIIGIFTFSFKEVLNNSKGLEDVEFISFPNSIRRELRNLDWVKDCRVKIKHITESCNLVGNPRMNRISSCEVEYIRNSLRQKK